MRLARGRIVILISLITLATVALTTVQPAAASGSSAAPPWSPPSASGPNGTPVPDQSQEASLEAVPSSGGGVAPDSGSCWTAGESPLQSYPVNTQENLCMVNDQNYVCNFSVEYGNFLSVAVAKLMLDSGSCDTNTSYSDDEVTAYYFHSGTASSITAFGPYSFGAWTQGTGPASSSIFEGQWIVCMEVTVGVPADGDQCLLLNSSPI
jgi:hypothetical protein